MNGKIKGGWAVLLIALTEVLTYFAAIEQSNDVKITMMIVFGLIVVVALLTQNPQAAKLIKDVQSIADDMTIKYNDANIKLHEMQKGGESPPGEGDKPPIRENEP